MNIFENEIAFRASGPAAVAVLDHKQGDREATAVPWVFAWGSVAVDGMSQAWAEFLYAPAAGNALMLAVISLKVEPGRYTVQHAITRADRQA